MKSVLFHFDRRLFDLLQEKAFTQFTIRDLRDAYASNLVGVNFRLGDVRLYVYEQVRRMVRAGWLVPDPERRRRGQVYHLKSFPVNLQLQLMDGGFKNGRKPVRKEYVKSSITSEPGVVLSEPNANSEQHLEMLLKEIRLDFLSSMGEAERYKQLFDDMPHLREVVEEDYLEARDRSSRLLGHLRAVEKTLKTFVSIR